MTNFYHEDWMCRAHGARGSKHRCRMAKYLYETDRHCDMVAVTITPKEPWRLRQGTNEIVLLKTLPTGERVERKLGEPS